VQNTLAPLVKGAAVVTLPSDACSGTGAGATIFAPAAGGATMT
jgi:hypothetical protein